MNEEKELFEWVKASDELPEKTGWYILKYNGHIRNTLYNPELDTGLRFEQVTGYTLAAIEWLKPIQSSLKEETKIVVWKDGTYKITEGQTWEYENDENWLVTIQSSLTPKSIRDSESELLEEIRQIKAVIIHFATLDKMPTLELLNRERLIEHVVTRAQNILKDYPPKKQL